MDTGTGAEYDDKSGGQSCSDARKDSESSRPSVTVYRGKDAVKQEVTDALRAFVGNGPKEIEYGVNDPFTKDFQKSAAMDAITSNCSETSGRVPIGTGEAFVNTLIDGIAGGAGFYNAEAQLGAFNSTYKRDGGRVDITVTNPISLNSLLFHRLGNSGNKQGGLER